MLTMGQTSSAQLQRQLVRMNDRRIIEADLELFKLHEQLEAEEQRVAKLREAGRLTSSEASAHLRKRSSLLNRIGAEQARMSNCENARADARQVDDIQAQQTTVKAINRLYGQTATGSQGKKTLQLAMSAQARKKEAEEGHERVAKVMSGQLDDDVTSEDDSVSDQLDLMMPSAPQHKPVDARAVVQPST
jgi:hypothetical protein